MAFHIAAQRSRGTSHRKTHTPCQDACRVARSVSEGRTTLPGQRRDELIFGAVSDGGGSRALSHIGARLTVSLAIASMKSAWNLDAMQDASPERLEAYWRLLCEDCRNLLRREAEARGLLGRDGMGDADPFACTLVAFMATRNRLAAAQVGDGFIVVGRPAGESADMASRTDYTLGFQNREVELAGQVVWLTASNWADDLRMKVIDGPIDLVIASSDGMEKAVLQPPVDRPGDELQPHAPYFEQLGAGCRQTVEERQSTGGDSQPALEDYLRDVLNSRNLEDRTDDDKSMAVAIWLKR